MRGQWDGRYNATYGSMADFLSAHDNVFACT